MAKKTNKKFSTKNIVILTALGLVLVGYFGYRSLLTSPDINLITSESYGSWNPNSCEASGSCTAVSTILKKLVNPTRIQKTKKQVEGDSKNRGNNAEQESQPNNGRSDRYDSK